MAATASRPARRTDETARRASQIFTILGVARACFGGRATVRSIIPRHCVAWWAVALDPEPGLAQCNGERLIDGPAGNTAVPGIAGDRIAVGFQRLGARRRRGQGRNVDPWFSSQCWRSGDRAYRPRYAAPRRRTGCSGRECEPCACNIGRRAAPRPRCRSLSSCLSRRPTWRRGRCPALTRRSHSASVASPVARVCGRSGRPSGAP